ncbi:PQQ-binding-like beta-propeller repeat protein [Actinomycetospora atypica]|uniref:PQQ-binding-like beta-propeller repeat protein n=1 Tax=Actinomycetospora atypica TaxID=1290095 RepID=A0ABV9YSF0_9PSEU
MLRRVLVVVGFLTTAVGAFLDRRGLGSWTLERRLDAWTVGVIVLAALAGLLALAGRRSGAELDPGRAGSRRVRVAGTALGTLALVGVVAVLVVAVGTGLPGPSLAVLTVGSGLLALVGVVGGFVDGPARAARPLVVGLTAVGAALLVVGACGVAVRLVVQAPVQAWSAVPASAVVVPAPVPTRPTGVAWTWTALDGVRDVQAAGPGVVVADDSGVTALDGPTGEPRWGFHRDGAALQAMAVSPDGRSVVLAHGSTGYGDDEAGLATVLDAATGARLAEFAFDDPGRALVLTDRIVVDPRPIPGPDDDPRTEYTALDLRTGEERWRWVSPAGCLQFALYATSTRTTIPVAAGCGDRVIVTGLDEESGRERWRTDAGPGEGSTTVALRATADGTAVVALGTRPFPLIDTTDGSVRTRITGGYPQLDEGEPRLGEDGVEGSDRRLDGTPLPPAPCAEPTTVVVGSVIAVCRGEGGSSATVDGGPPILLARISTGGPALEALDAGVRVVPAPGAVVVAGTSQAAPVVQGLT